MKIEVGMYMRVDTKSPRGHEESGFGTCVYVVTEVGIECPEEWRKKDAKGKALPADQIPHDGVRCVMIGGSGPMARAGYTVVDSVAVIEKNIKDGIASMISGQEAKRLEASLRRTVEQAHTSSGMAGALEID